MKLNNAEISNWVVELRDGAFEMQRVFQFDAQANADAFVSFVGSYMECPGLTVVTSSALLPKPLATVRIHLLPEQALLKAAGEIATTCEHEYEAVQAHLAQSAA